MKHPSPDSWMELLYGESTPQQTQKLRSHLVNCPECRVQFETWTRAHGELDRDLASPPPVAPRSRLVPLWNIIARWAIAASWVALIGYWAGLKSRPSQADVDRQIAGLRNEMSDLLQAGGAGTSPMVQAFARITAEHEAALQLLLTRQEEERKLWLVLLQRREAEHRRDVTLLAQDLVALARETGRGFEQTEASLQRIALHLPGPDLETQAPVSPPGTIPDPRP